MSENKATSCLLYAIGDSGDGGRRLTVFNGNTLTLSVEMAADLARSLVEPLPPVPPGVVLDEIDIPSINPLDVTASASGSVGPLESLAPGHVGVKFTHPSGWSFSAAIPRERFREFADQIVQDHENSTGAFTVSLGEFMERLSTLVEPLLAGQASTTMD